MYIPEFVCGIGFTIIAEIFLLILHGMSADLISDKKKKNEKKG